MQIKKITRKFGTDDVTDWVLFENGNWSKPLAILSDNEMKALIDQYESQSDDYEEDTEETEPLYDVKWNETKDVNSRIAAIKAHRVYSGFNLRPSKEAIDSGIIASGVSMNEAERIKLIFNDFGLSVYLKEVE